VSDRLPEGYREYTAQLWTESVDNAVRRLREMADKIERRRVPDPRLKDMRKDYLGAVKEIINEGYWGMANAHLDGLLPRAWEAQDAEDRTPTDGA
jgi:hypothetical protein